MSQTLQQIIAEIAKRTAEEYDRQVAVSRKSKGKYLPPTLSYHITRALESLVEKMPPDPETVKVLEAVEKYSSDWENHPKTHLEEIHAIVTMQLSLMKGA